MAEHESKEQIYADALAQAGVVKLWLENQKADTEVALAAQREMRLTYSTLVQQLIERTNVREAEHKAQMNAVEAENRRLKTLADGIATLEYSFLESRAIVLQMQENEEKILKELRKSQREALEARARYEALVVHSEHKLAEANAEVQRLNESYANENSTLKAKLARYESTSSALQQTAAMKDKELSQLRAHSDQLMERLSRAGV